MQNPVTKKFNKLYPNFFFKNKHIPTKKQHSGKKHTFRLKKKHSGKKNFIYFSK